MRILYAQIGDSSFHCATRLFMILGVALQPESATHQSCAAQSGYLLTSTQLHWHPVFRSQSKAGNWNNRRTVDVAQLESRGNRCKEKHGFHRCEPCPDALSRTPSEGKVSEARERLTAFRPPTVRIKTHRILEESGIVLQKPLAHHYICSSWYAIPSHLKFVCYFTRETPSGRVKPHRFFDHTIRINQQRYILQSWNFAAKNRVDFLMELVLRVWILSQ
jgi:hypothetical protein